MKVYIGCPIDTARPDHSPAEQMKEISDIVLGAFGDNCLIFNPFTAFVNAHRAYLPEDLTYLVRINEFALANADIGVFVWNGSPSFGVPLEIDYCSKRNLPFVVWNRSGKPLGLYLRQRIGKVAAAVDTSQDVTAWLLNRGIKWKE